MIHRIYMRHSANLLVKILVVSAHIQGRSIKKEDSAKTLNGLFE